MGAGGTSAPGSRRGGEAVAGAVLSAIACPAWLMVSGAPLSASGATGRAGATATAGSGGGAGTSGPAPAGSCQTPEGSAAGGTP